MPTDDLSGFCCQNPDCPRSGECGGGNLSVCDRFAKANHRPLFGHPVNVGHDPGNSPAALIRLVVDQIGQIHASEAE